MDSESKLKKLYQLADQLQSARDVIAERQAELNVIVDKFQEKINNVFVKLYSAISTIESERDKCVGHEDNYGAPEGQPQLRRQGEIDKGRGALETVIELEVVSDDEGPFETPSKQPRLDLGNDNGNNKVISEIRSDLSKNVVSDAEILALEEAKIPEQFENFSTTRFPRTVDWRNAEIYHGVERITSAHKLEAGKLMKYYDCFCGMKFPKYTPFYKHFFNNSASRHFSARCSLCGKGFKEYCDLVMHSSKIHGITLEDEPPIPAAEGRHEMLESRSDSTSQLLKVDEKALLMTLEADKIPAQLEHLSSDRFKKTVDWRDCNIHHGLKNITPDWKMINGKLLRTYECWCGLEFPNYSRFQQHFDNCSDSKSANYSFRCVLCGKGFRKDCGLLEHSKKVHGIRPESIPQAETRIEDKAIRITAAPGKGSGTNSVTGSGSPKPVFRGNLLNVPIQVDAKRRSEMLEAWRDSTSKLLKVTPYCVLLDSQLNSLAENPPASKELLCEQLGEPQVELLGNFIHTLFRLLSEGGESFFEQMQYRPTGSETRQYASIHSSQQTTCSRPQNDLSGFQVETNSGEGEQKNKKWKKRPCKKTRLRMLKQQGAGAL